MLNEKRPGQQP